MSGLIRLITNVLRPSDTTSCDMQSNGKQCCVDDSAGRREAEKLGMSVCPKNSGIKSNSGHRTNKRSRL